jgi:8-oxo-dGTP diphosphatase
MDFRVAVDVVIFTISADAPVASALEVLLVKRGIAPFRGRWAIPGGFVLPKESLPEAALRELQEETGVRDVYLEQLYTFGDPGRDPRGRVVSVTYFALIAADQRPLVAGSDAAEARFWPMSALPTLAFDHDGILGYALDRLRNKLEYTTVGFQLLPAKFTLSELQRVYEAILGRALDKRNFRRKLALLDVLVPLSEHRASGRRPAQLYRFSQRQFEKLKDKGILFPF